LDGISNETGIRTKWDTPIPMLWDQTVGSSFSSFACVDDRVYTCGTRDGRQVVYCLHADTGQILWSNDFEAEYPEAQGGDGTRATPTIDQGKLYLLGARGRLICLDAGSGELIWDHRFKHMPSWGYSASVLIEGKLAIATGGKSDGALAAFDKNTGKEVWSVGEDQAGYATPYPFTFRGKRYVAGFTGESVIVVEADSGKQAARYEWATSFDVNAAMPIYHDEKLFISSGYFTGCGLLKLGMDAGRLTMESIWKSGVLKNKFQSCILHEGNLYSSDQRALVCADFETGEERWRVHRLKHGTLVLADGHLLLLTQDGELQIAPVSANGWSPVTKARLLSGRCWTVPVLHEGRLYVRNLDRVACFDLRQGR
jgi:outer membrane protein assembly factor BamB